MDKRGQPFKKEGTKVLTELRFHRKPSPNNTQRKVVKPQIKKEPSIAKSNSSGFSHLAGDVDRWIHGSGTNVASDGPGRAKKDSIVDGGGTVDDNVSTVPSNATFRTAEPYIASIGVQSSRHQQQRTTMISGVHLPRNPCFTLGMLLMNLETGFGSVSSIANVVRFLASQVHQVCMGCVLDGRRALQLGLPANTLGTRMYAFAMDALLLAYAMGFAALVAYQLTGVA